MYSCRGGTYLIIPVVSSRSFKSFYFPVAPGLFTGYPSLCFKERLRLQSSSQILKHLCDFSLPNVDLGLQSFQCSEIRSAQHWERRAAHLSENKGVKRECKKFGENSRQMAPVSTICDEYCSTTAKGWFIMGQYSANKISLPQGQSYTEKKYLLTAPTI